MKTEETIKIDVNAEACGKRVDAFLSQILENQSRSCIQRLIEEGCITINDATAKKKDRLKGNEQIKVMLPKARVSEVIPQSIPLCILYEDKDLLVVDKPKGMVVHPAAGNPDGTLVNALLAHCGSSLSGIGGTIRPGIVHRIDKETSGLLIVAKNDFTHKGLSEQIKIHDFTREYKAVVMGHLKEEQATIDKPIGRHKTDRKKMGVHMPFSRPAVTQYETLARYPGYTYVKCRLQTGRTHQIRVHFASIGHPIAGDKIYNSDKNDKARFPTLQGQCLHAYHIAFVHPRDGRIIDLESPLPMYFMDVLTKLEKMV